MTVEVAGPEWQDDGARPTEGSSVLEQMPVKWTLPRQIDPFLEWLDGAVEADSDEEAVTRFMDLPIAAEMPYTLRDDLRRVGLLT